MSAPINPPAKKSASLIILKPRPKKDEFSFDYDILFIKRKGTLSFGNTFAFPGGGMDKEDKMLAENYIPDLKNLDFDERTMTELKITALRETFEETGLYFSSNKTFAESLMKNPESPGTSSYAEILQQNVTDLRKIQPFIRLITIQFAPKRYDTQFFITVVENDTTLNMGALKKGEDIRNLSNLSINLEESDEYVWMSPAHAIFLHFVKKKLRLAPPQVIILGMLVNFLTSKAVIQFLTRIKAQNSKNKELADYLRRNPLVFPQLGSARNTANNWQFFSNKDKSISYFPGDPLYPIEEIIRNEPEGELKEELKSKLKTIEIRKDQKARYSGINLVEFKFDFLNVLSLLNGREQVFTLFSSYSKL